MVERELSTLSATEASAVRLAHEKLMAPVWVSVPREGFMPGADVQIQKADHRTGSPVSPPSKIQGQRSSTDPNPITSYHVIISLILILTVLTFTLGSSTQSDHSALHSHTHYHVEFCLML